MSARETGQQARPVDAGGGSGRRVRSARDHPTGQLGRLGGGGRALGTAALQRAARGGSRRYRPMKYGSGPRCSCRTGYPRAAATPRQGRAAYGGGAGFGVAGPADAPVSRPRPASRSCSPRCRRRGASGRSATAGRPSASPWSRARAPTTCWSTARRCAARAHR